MKAKKNKACKIIDFAITYNNRMDTMENKHFKILSHYNKHCNQVIEVSRPDIVIIDRDKKEEKIIDVAIRGESRVKCKERGKIEKYQPLREEIGKLW